MWRLLKQMPILRDPVTRRRLKQLPGIRHAIRTTRRTRRVYYRNFGQQRLKRLLADSPVQRVVIGAWGRYDEGWIPTQRDFLDLTKPSDWARFFRPNSVEAMLAEHVWEHLTPEEGLAAAKTCFTYLKNGGYLRVAVPDGLHPDPAYIETVKAGAPVGGGDNASSSGSSSTQPVPALDGNAANHKALYTYATLKALFEKAGFQVILYEFFDETGKFHFTEWDQRSGTIWRSKRFDPRNKAGTLASVYPGSLGDYLSYSSIILDAVKQVGIQPAGFLESFSYSAAPSPSMTCFTPAVQPQAS
jgi:predicted SAM-dependent methyltransferase